MADADLSARPPAGTVICRLDEIADGSGRVFAIGPEDAPFRVLVLRSGDRVQAWHNRCPHFGMPLALKDEWLILKPHVSVSCNVHYSRFRWDDGVCVDGECEGEALTPLPVTLRDGLLVFGSD